MENDGYDFMDRPFQVAGDVPRDAAGRDQYGNTLEAKTIS